MTQIMNIINNNNVWSIFFKLTLCKCSLHVNGNLVSENVVQNKNDHIQHNGLIDFKLFTFLYANIMGGLVGNCLTKMVVLRIGNYR